MQPSFPSRLLALSFGLAFLLAAPGCKRAPKRWTLERDGLHVEHVQPKVRPGQGAIPLTLQVRGRLRGTPRLVWSPAEKEEFRAVPMKPRPAEAGGKELQVFQGEIPFLGPGKGVRYHFLLPLAGGGEARFPEKGEWETTCKGKVGTALLVAHIGAMFLGLLLLILVAWRCLVFLTKGTSLHSAARMVKIATFFIFLGGLPLGMLVERKVFGTWWEGWPFGRDVTDTKTGVILALWLLLSFKAPKPGAGTEKKARAWAWAVLAALVFTVVLYIIPHENLKF